LRGTRYVLAATVPVATFMVVMSGPLLETWLGHRYVEAQAGLAILVAYWLFGANTGVLGSMMWAHGQGRVLAILAWATAGANLALSLILTPLIGLNGVVLGTTGAYALIFPFFLRAATRAIGVSIHDLAVSAWRPVYPFAACLAAALLALRLALPDARPVVLLAIGSAGLAAYWAAFYAFSLDRAERVFFRALLSRSGGVPAEPTP
jgi:O-antigen/teichoic acid export membrane protein